MAGGESLDLLPVEEGKRLFSLGHQLADLLAQYGEVRFGEPLNEFRLVAMKLDLFHVEFIGDELRLFFQRMEQLAIRGDQVRLG